MELVGPRFDTILLSARLSFDLHEAILRSGAENLDTFTPWNAFTDISTKKVYLGSLYLLAKNHPKYLRLIFSHELAHLLGPMMSLATFNSQNRINGFKPWSSPELAFRNELECLRKDAGGTTQPRSRDIQCMLSHLDSLSKNLKMPPSQVEFEKLTLLSSPIASIPSRDSKGLQCQMDHTEEIFADWIALRATARPATDAGELVDMLADFAPTLKAALFPMKQNFATAIQAPINAY